MSTESAACVSTVFPCYSPRGGPHLLLPPCRALAMVPDPHGGGMGHPRPPSTTDPSCGDRAGKETICERPHEEVLPLPAAKLA